jgi:hypothetical protein
MESANVGTVQHDKNGVSFLAEPVATTLTITLSTRHEQQTNQV